MLKLILLAFGTLSSSSQRRLLREDCPSKHADPAAETVPQPQEQDTVQQQQHEAEQELRQQIIAKQSQIKFVRGSQKNIHIRIADKKATAAECVHSLENKQRRLSVLEEELARLEARLAAVGK